MYAKTMEIYWFLVGTIRVSRYLISENRRLSKPLMTFTQVMIWLCLTLQEGSEDLTVSNTDEKKPTLVKPVPPSNPRDNTAVQQRFQRSANRFSASGEKTIFVHSDYESNSMFLRVVLKKKEKPCLHPFLISETLTSPQSLSISQILKDSQGMEIQYALVQITEGRIYKALIKVKI